MNQNPTLQIATEKGQITIICGHEKLDRNAIHQYLTRSYWSMGIDFATVNLAINNSICFGVFNASDQQIGFARLVTDSATFAYLCDVYMLEEYRGLGISKALMAQISAHEVMGKVRRAMLATRDAHGLYRQFGFAAIEKPEILMQINRPDIYKK